MGKFNPAVNERAITKTGEGVVTLREKGWIHVQLDNGTTVKARASELRAPGDTAKTEKPVKAPKADKPAKVKADKPVKAPAVARPRGIKANGEAGGDIFPPGLRSQYSKTKVKDANGKTKVKLDCGDEIAEALRGLEVEDVYKVAGELMEGTNAKALREQYAHLNRGQQRMVVGVRLRKVDGISAGLIKKTRKSLSL